MGLITTPIASDPNNSSTANLAGGAFFTGTASTAPMGGVITVFLCTDQVCNVYFEQSADGVNWDHQLIFTPDADRFKEGFGGRGDTESWSIRSLALYYRVRVENPTAITTTYFRLATRLAVQGNGGVSFLVDDDGHPIEAHESATGNFHLGVAAVQAIEASLLNSYSGTIGAAGSWVGGNESSLDIAGIQTILKTDQNCTVYIDQSSDSGTNYDVTDSYVYYYAKGGASWTTQAVGSSYRVRIQNNGNVATTYTRLTTALCPIVEAVPRALSTNGNFSVAVNELLGTFGSQVKSTPMGQLRTADSTRLVGAGFGDSTNIDANFWGSVAVGSGTITDSGNQANIITGVVADSAGTLTSTRSARYVASNANYYRGVVRAPAVTGANRRRWGAYNTANGFFFEHDGTTLSVVCRKSGSDANRVSSGSFNGDGGNTYTLDANAHTYEIYWTNKSAWFLIDDVIVHKFIGSTSTLTSSNTLPSASDCANLAGNTNSNTLEIRTASISRLGPLQTESQYKYIAASGTTVCKLGAGRLHRFICGDPDAAAQSVTIADSINGNSPIIAVLTWPNAANTMQPVSIEFGCPFFTGLTVVTNTANPYTLIYE